MWIVINPTPNFEIQLVLKDYLYCSIWKVYQFISHIYILFIYLSLRIDFRYKYNFVILFVGHLGKMWFSNLCKSYNSKKKSQLIYLWMLLREFQLLGISQAHGSRFLFVFEKTPNILGLKKSRSLLVIFK